MEENPLDEKDFIQGPKKGGGLTTATWAIVFIGVVAFGFLMFNQMKQELFLKKKNTPFLNVTNRDFSVFLWQNFNEMKLNHKDVIGYLPGFQSNQPGIKEGEADQLVQAPPELLFLYHTWKRLIKEESVLGKISGQEFIDFLKEHPEWTASNWKSAPTGYKELLKLEFLKGEKDISSRLPLNVAISVEGWKVISQEEKAFNAYRPTVDEFKTFVKEHPHYAKNYWQNIMPYVQVEQGEIPLDELPFFLRLALFLNRPKS